MSTPASEAVTLDMMRRLVETECRIASESGSYRYETWEALLGLLEGIARPSEELVERLAKALRGNQFPDALEPWPNINKRARAIYQDDARTFLLALHAAIQGDTDAR